MSYLKGRNASHTYLRRYFAETDKVDNEAMFEFEDSTGNWHLMPYGTVIEAIMSAPQSEQEKIASMIRRIDFANGDVTDYLRHLGRALAEMALKG